MVDEIETAPGWIIFTPTGNTIDERALDVTETFVCAAVYMGVQGGVREVHVDPNDGTYKPAPGSTPLVTITENDLTNPVHMGFLALQALLQILPESCPKPSTLDESSEDREPLKQIGASLDRGEMDMAGMQLAILAKRRLAIG